MKLLPLVLLLVVGCGSPANTSQPVATVAPEITARDVEEIVIRQMQHTEQTTNFALDGERAKLARAAGRDQMKLMLSGAGMIMGFALLCFFTDCPISGPKRWVGVIVAISIIVGSLVIPAIWPL